MINRQAFRPFALDGAQLYFQPATGLHLRIENEATRHLKRRAPRVVMFGITNKCNLRCDFCSRDTTRESSWTVASASAALRGLADAGTLEVAFGGGEPFAFRGFAELVAELHANTPLVLNVTTNGSLINQQSFAAYAGRFGQVRVSLYEGVAWRAACRVLTNYGQRWGANLIVDDAVLPTLSTQLAELAALGCQDVSLLAYIGPDISKHLSRAGRAQLAEIVEDAPLDCRLSVCFGDDIALERLFNGADGSGDCGAGLDFVSITPDKKMLGCSFQDGGIPAASAEEILAAWQTQRSRMLQAAQRKGCARCKTKPNESVGNAVRKVPPITIWQAFSGNNSGECVMVAKFETVEDANAYLAQLLPGWQPESSFSPEWQQLLKEQGICRAAVPVWCETPSELLAIGRSVIAVGYDADDQFPHLRALAWKNGAYLVPGGIHVHDQLHLLAAVRGVNEDDARKLATIATLPANVQAYLHGELVLLSLALQEPGEDGMSLRAASEFLHTFAGNRPLAAEMVFEVLNQASMLAAKIRLASPFATKKRLAIKFYSYGDQDKASRFAPLVGEATSSMAGACILVSGLERRKRLAVLAYRHGADVSALDGAEVEINAYFHLPLVKQKNGRPAQQQPTRDFALLEAESRSRFSADSHLSLSKPEWRQHAAYLTLRSTRPDAVFAELSSIAQILGAELSLNVSEVEPLAMALRRVIADVHR